MGQTTPKVSLYLRLERIIESVLSVGEYEANPYFISAPPAVIEGLKTSGSNGKSFSFSPLMAESGGNHPKCASNGD